MGVESLPFPILDPKGPGRLVGIIHGIGLRLVLGQAQRPLMLGGIRRVGVGRAKSPSRGRSSEERKQDQGKGSEDAHIHKNAQPWLVFP